MAELLPSHELLELDTPREACGVFGIYAPGKNAATLTYLGLHELQHRGQDAAGIAVADRTGFVTIENNLGLVSEVFPKGVSTLEEIADGAGIAIGHDRYGTIKTDDDKMKLRAAHPLQPEGGGFVTAFNGHIANYEGLGKKYGYNASDYVTDSECFTKILGDFRLKEMDGDVVRALIKLLPEAEGAISMVMTDGHRLIAARDRNGFRPLSIGRFPDGGYVIASEPPAIEIVGAEFERSVIPGEVVVVDEKGLHSYQVEAPKSTFCSFEYAYFARPDSILEGRNVHLVRQELGRQLAREDVLENRTPEVDMVIGVPDSGLSAALGYSKELGIPLEQGLTKSRYVPRTFIKDQQISREQSAQMKYHPNRAVIEGQRLIVVDDSIIRGTTTKTLVSMLRRKGATEVHLRIPSPPNTNSCHYGMDTGDPEELIANKLSIDEICEYVGADSLAYISQKGFEQSITGVRNQRLGSLCMACMDGNYPTPVPGQPKMLPLLIK